MELESVLSTILKKENFQQKGLLNIFLFIAEKCKKHI